MREEPQEHTVELFVRSLAADEAQPELERTVQRLEKLVEDDHIDGYEVHVWGDRVSRSPVVARTDAGAFIRNRVIEFREWAADEGVTLPGGFESESTHSAITGETHEYITLPTAALAERRDGELEAVAPHADDGDVTTVLDHLASLHDDIAADASQGPLVAATDD